MSFMEQTTLQLRQKKVSEKAEELERFKERHSEAFLYFLEEYEKWRELRGRNVSEK